MSTLWNLHLSRPTASPSKHLPSVATFICSTFIRFNETLSLTPTVPHTTKDQSYLCVKNENSAPPDAVTDTKEHFPLWFNRNWFWDCKQSVWKVLFYIGSISARKWTEVLNRIFFHCTYYFMQGYNLQHTHQFSLTTSIYPLDFVNALTKLESPLFSRASQSYPF